MWATKQGCSDVALLLLKYKANIEATDKVSNYPIFVTDTYVYVSICIYIYIWLYLSVSYIYAPAAVIGGVEECSEHTPPHMSIYIGVYIGMPAAVGGGAEECTLNTRLLM